MSVDELLCLLRKAVRGDQVVLVATAAEHIHVVGAAEAHHSLGQRIEHRLQVESGAADGLEHIGAGSLLQERFLKVLLNILYDPRVRPGMTKEEVNRVLPDVLPTVRAWVTDANLPRHADGRNGPDANPTQAMTAALLRSVNAQTSRGTREN